MNFSLHLQTTFTFVRQNKAKSQGKNTTHTRIQELYQTFACLHLNLTVDLFWLKGVLKTQSMHIYIYTYIKGHEVVRCCKHMLFAFSHGYNISLVSNVRSQGSHLNSPVMASLKPSSWLYFLDAILGGGNQCVAKKMSQSTSTVSIRSREPLRRCCWMTV